MPGHDCQIGNHVIFSGFATAAGHVTVGDYAILAGCCAVHQFVSIGEHAMVGAMARVSQDVLPYTIVEGHPAVTRSVNSIGMQRRGFSEEDLKAVRMCYKKLFVNKKLTVHEALEELRHSGYAENACLRRIIQFVETSERGSAIESMKTGFVFDLDGTLVDSIPGIARGLNLALKALGYPEHSVDAIREMVGQGRPGALPGFPERLFQRKCAGGSF